MPTPETAADLLGSTVWDALAAAEYDHAPAGSGRDGFDILKDPGSDGHVVVLCRREGALCAGGNKPARWLLVHWHRILTDAEFVVRLHEHRDMALCLVVAVEDGPADAALQTLRDYAASVDGRAS